MIVIRFFAAMALKKFLHAGARARDPSASQPGLREFKMYTGIFFWIAGSTVAGCKTFAPKYASSAASSKLMA